MDSRTLHSPTELDTGGPTLTLPLLVRAFDTLLVLGGLLAAEIGIWLIRPEFWRDPGGPWPWAMLAAGALVGGAGLRRMERWLPDPSPAARPIDKQKGRRRWVGAAALLVALFLIVWVVMALWPDYRRWQGPLMPWLLALALVLAGSWLLGSAGEPSADYAPAIKRHEDTSAGSRPQPVFLPAPWQPYLRRGIEILLFLLILALAVFLRVHRLDEIPAALYVDETNAALDALYILEGRGDSPFGTGWYETPSGYSYYMAAIFSVFGVTYTALKAASLIPALLTIPALYLLGRALFGPAAGLAAMFLLAISRWHMTLSRWGWNELMPPLFQILATYFLIRGLRERRALDYALGGLLTGLVLYTYLSSRLAVLTLGLFLLYWLATEGTGLAAVRRQGPGLALYVVAAVIAAAPLAVTYASQPFLFLNRTRELSIFKEVEITGSWQPLGENLLRHIRLFYEEGDPVGRQNLPGEPQADPITGMLLAVGVGYALLGLGDRRRGLLLLWLVIAMAGGFLSEMRVRYDFAPDYIVSPNSYRTLAAMMAVALAGGDVATRLGSAFYHIWPRPAPQRIVNGAVGVALLIPMFSFAAAWETGLYFGKQADAVEVQTSFNQMETKVAYAVVEALMAGTDVYLSPNFYNFSPLRFLVYGAVRHRQSANPLDYPPFHLARPEVDLPLPATEGGVLYLLDHHYAAVIDYITDIYPTAQVDEVRDSANKPLFLSIWIPPADLVAQQGLVLEVTESNGDTWQRRVDNLNDDGGRGSHRRVWRGSVRLAQSGLYQFVAASAQVEIDGDAGDRLRYLGRGLHSLTVTQEGDATERPPALFWRRPDGRVEAVPPTAYFRTPLPDQGLTALYYANDTWTGPPLLQQVTPFLLLAWPPHEPLPHPFSASFIGTLQIDDAGAYNFRLNADDGVRFVLDGNILGESLLPDRPNQIRVGLELAPGLYPLRIDYFQRYGGSALEFFWQPPGRPESPVPPDVLHPMP